MNSLRISLFGRFQIERDGETLTDLYPRKLQELFCYLLLNRDCPHPRETVATVLWGDSLTAQSKKYLRQALWQFQTAMNSCGRESDPCVLLVDPDMICVNPGADLWLDVAAFERAIVRTQGVAGADLDPQQVQALCEAADLYLGDLLEGWYQDWCLYERERLQNMYLMLLDKLMDYCEAHAQYEAGLDYGSRILRHDQARERTHRRLMRLYSLVGDRTAALRQYDCCVRALRRELDVRPAARTITLYEQIRAERFPGAAESPVASPQTLRRTDAQWPEMLEHLVIMQRTLSRVQDELQRAIGAAETVMKG